MTAITLAAPAKVNLLLDVGGRRADGYHDVTTVLVALELHDDVTVAEASALTLACEPDLGLPPQENLAWRAAEAVARALDREPALALRVTKRIPARAGLGGGSADAAAVIAGACRLWGVDPALPAVTEAARSLGADVPFLIAGGAALYGGRGDELIETLPTPELHIVLVNPGVDVPTPAAYAAFDRMLAPPALDPAPLTAALRAGDAAAAAAALANDLTDASAGYAPAIRDALGLVRSAPGVLGAQMAGSGATVFGICEDATAARAAAEQAAARDWWAVATRSIEHGPWPLP
jgi:4-diphosphocytidyl-2-C-methyl-D-erythritol kinase